MTEWYVCIDGQERGPGGTDALRGYLKDSDPKRVHVWREGFDDWKLASEVPELSGQMRPPPLPPELSGQSVLHLQPSSPVSRSPAKRPRR